MRNALAGLIVTLLVCSVFTNAAWAESAEVEIEITPQSVAIPAEGSVQVLVVARNLATYELTDVRLSWFTDAAVDVQVASAPSNVLAPNGALTWDLRLSRAGDAPLSGAVHLRLDYTRQGDPEAPPAPGVAVASLGVMPRASQPVGPAPQVAVKTALTSLNEQRPGTVYLVVSNPSELPIRVKGIEPRGPGFVAFAGAQPEDGVTLAPGEAQAFAYEVSAAGPVQPGKHLLLFEVLVEGEDGGRTWTWRGIATHEVDVGVFGESTILTAVGVPSFLILPGVLMLLTVQVLWRFAGPQTEFPLKVKTAEWGLIAVTLSLLAALVYPVLTEWAGGRRSYLERYELTDVMWVWFGSVVVAAAGYFLAVGGSALGRRVVEAYRAWRRGLSTPAAGDTPIDLLVKLHRQGLGLQLARVDVQTEGGVRRGYLLEPWDEGRETIWIGPHIVVEWLVGADRELQRDVAEHLGPKGSPAALAELLKEGRAHGALKVTWGRIGTLSHPRQVAQDDAVTLAPGMIVQQE